MALDDAFDTFLTPKERLVSFSLEELMLLMVTNLSYRECAGFLNRVMHRDGGDLFHHRTLADHAESIGKRVSKALSDTASTILCTNGFDPITATPLDVESLPGSITAPRVTDISDEQWDGKGIQASLLENHLMENRHLVFFSDGAQNIRANIDKYFSYRPYSLILDWYHLVKRIRELSSMAFKMNKEKKQETIRRILRILWPGNVDKAKDYIRTLPDKSIKNKYYVEEMASYLERKKPNITCHAARRPRNLRISSNTSEKANDCLVAQRQKHNGMSWSFEGSEALAVLATLKIKALFRYCSD